MKRGLLILFVCLFLVSSVYGASLSNVSLKGNKFGPGVPFEGGLLFSFTDTKFSDTQIDFFSGTLKLNTSLGRLFNVSNVKPKINPARYNTTSSGFEGLSVSGTKTEVGIDLRGNNRNPGEVSLTGDYVSFDVAPGPTAPSDLVISLEDKVLYKYRGAALDFKDLDKSYLVGTADGNAEIGGGDVLCQLVNLTDSNQYKLKAKIKKNPSTPANVKLNISLNDFDMGFSKPDDCGNPKTPCCTLSDAGNDFTEVGCTVNKIVPENSLNYICLYSTDDNSENTYFSIQTDNDKQSFAFANGAAIDDNFYIYGSYMTYDKTLSQKTNAKVPKDLFDDYIHKNGCGNDCLLIPLKTSMSNSGTVELSGLSLKYNYQVKREEKSFKKITFIPESLSYNGNINVDLSKLDEVVSPSVVGKYVFYNKFDGLESDKVNFEVIPGPKAFIRYGPFMAGANEQIIFDASGTTNVEGRNLTSYLWSFGDGTNGSTGVSVMHTYSIPGDYVIKLKVFDSLNIYGYDSLIINIQNSSSVDISGLINQTILNIGNFKKTLESGPAQTKDTANLLGISGLLNNLESNLTSLNKQYGDILADEKLTEAQKVSAAAPLMDQVRNIGKQIPTSLNVDSASFSAKVTGLNQIPSCCEFLTEVQKTKLFNAQQQVKVNAEARSISVSYADGRKENFNIIKKDIIGAGIKIYELVPYGINILPANVIVGGQVTAPAPNLYSFAGTNQIVYRVDTLDLNQALQTKTIVLPENLENYTVQYTEPEEQTEIPSVCGNSICESGEDENSCAKDCKSNNGLILTLGIIVLIIALGVFGFLFIRNRMIRKKYEIKVGDHGGASKTFKNEKDHSAVKDFVEHSLHSGQSEDKIKTSLKAKGWTEQQVSNVINEVKESKRNAGQRR